MSREETQICVIEDDAAQRALLVARLRGLGYDVIEAAGGAEGLALVTQRQPRIVICDVCLPELDGVEICRRVRSDQSLDGLYFILVTAHSRSHTKREALEAGADDFLSKPFDMDEMAARIRNGLRLWRLQQRLERAAVTDGLTGLWNHTQFRLVLDREFSRTRRYGGVVSLLMIDLDHFKAINDTFGHEVGNHVLRETAAHLCASVRETDLVARYGGEEFAVVCPQTDLAEATRLAERMRESFPQEVRIEGQPHLAIHCSIGVACSNDPRVHCVADLADMGDRALYRSKRDGRNRVTTAEMLGYGPATRRSSTPGGDEVDRLRKEVYALSMRSKELCLQSIGGLIQALDARDRYSAWHSRNVTTYTQWLVQAAGWPPALCVAATNAAMLHELGKIGLSDDLLAKPRPLDPRERATLQEVPLTTCRILEPLRVFETEIVIIRHLREHFDGTGFPDRLAGEDIPIGSRLVAVAEAFDSMTCNRAYRPGRPLDDVLAEIEASAGRQFDPRFVKLLIRCVDRDRQQWQAQIDQALHELPELATAAR